MHRDELVLCVNQPLNDTSMITMDGRGYPSVLTTLGDIGKPMKKMILTLYAKGDTGKNWMKEKVKLTSESYVTSQCDSADRHRVLMQAPVPVSRVALTCNV